MTDAAASTTIINQQTVSTGVIGAAVALLVSLGVGAALLAGTLTDSIHHLTPTEKRLVERSQALDLDLSGASDADLDARLMASLDETRTVSALMQSDGAPADLAWVDWLDGRQSAFVARPTRLQALRTLVTFLATLPVSERGTFIDQLRSDFALTPRAHDLLQDVMRLPSSEDAEIGDLLARLVRLPADQRRIIEAAGFPAVPQSPERRLLYQSLSTIDDQAANFLNRVLTDTAQHRASVMQISEALRGPVASRALGALRDGDPAVTTAVATLPTTCSAAIPHSCVLTSR